MLSECVLIYLTAEEADAMIAACANRFVAAAFALYEQVHPNDAFGATMVASLEVRCLRNCIG